MISKLLATVTINEIIDNPDGSATIVLDIPDEVKQSLKEQFKWKRWSNKRFNQLVVEGLMNYVKEIEAKNGNR